MGLSGCLYHTVTRPWKGWERWALVPPRATFPGACLSLPLLAHPHVQLCCSHRLFWPKLRLMLGCKGDGLWEPSPVWES